MPAVNTKYFGTMTCGDDSTFDFPFGLPAFEEEKRFVLIEAERHAPLVFLQSLAHAQLCFLALPILTLDPGYQLAVTSEDLEALELDPNRQPDPRADVLVLALISLRDGFSPTANFMAPVVVNLRTRRGLQAIRSDSLYSHRHPVAPSSVAAEVAPPC